MKIFDFFFGNIFRFAVTAIAVVFAITHHPVASDVTVLVAMLGMVSFMIGVVYGYVAQSPFFDRGGVRIIVALFGWAVILGIPAGTGFAYFTPYEGVLDPTSVANVKAIFLVVFVTLTHATLGVIWNILSTRTMTYIPNHHKIQGGSIQRNTAY